MKRTRARVLIFAATLCFCRSGFCQTRTVALSAQTAPGLSSTAPFSQFARAVLNDHGQVALVGTAGGVSGVWSEGAGSGLSLISNNQPTSSSGVKLSNFQRIVLNDRGQLAIEAGFTGGASPNVSGVGLWTSGINGPLDLVVREGQLASEHPNGAFLNDFLQNSFGASGSPPILNDAGQLGFRGLLRGPGINGSVNNDKGLWWDLGTGVTPVIFSRDTTTGLANGLDSIGFGQPVINNHGQMLVKVNLAPSGISQSLLLASPNGTLSTIASSSDGFSSIAAVTPGRLNDAGDVAFIASRAGSGRSIWVRQHAGSLGRIIRSQDFAPGGGGLTYDTLGDPIINSQGRIAFGGYLKGPGVVDVRDHFGIWATRSSQVEKIVLAGDTAPGLDNAVFGRLDPSFTFNRNGQIAFQGLAVLLGGQQRHGIWATNQFGELKLIASAGTQIDVDNGAGIDLRTVSIASMLVPDQGGTGNEDGLASAFNELGQLAFLATFTDGSRGVFVSNAVAVPEPAIAGQLIVVAFAFFLSRATSKAGGPGY